MKKNTLKKILACLLLGFTLLHDTVPYKHLLNYSRTDIQIRNSKTKNGLDVGKAD